MLLKSGLIFLKKICFIIHNGDSAICGVDSHLDITWKTQQVMIKI